MQKPTKGRDFLSELSCSFTGHRIILRAHRETLPDIVCRVIKSLAESGVRIFQSGGALGFDLLAARSVIALKESGLDISLRMILPCRTQSRLWNLSERREYEYVLSRADAVEYVSDAYTPSCMHERNRRLVDTADIIAAYLMRTRGGTASTVAYAEYCGKKVLNLAENL